MAAVAVLVFSFAAVIDVAAVVVDCFFICALAA